MTIGRAPGSSVVLARPERLARARAHLARRQRRRGQHRGRRLERGHARRRRRDLARRPRCTTARASSSARRRCASSAAATWPRRAARSWSSPGASLVVPVDRAARRGRAGDAVRDEAAGALGLRAQAPRRQRGRQALGAQGPQPQHVPAAVRQRRAPVRAARRHALAGRPDRDRRAALRLGGRAAARAPARRPRRARLPGRRRGHGHAAEEDAAGLPPAAVQAAREDVRAGRRLVRGALPPRRLGAVHASPRCTRSRR